MIELNGSNVVYFNDKQYYKCTQFDFSMKFRITKWLMDYNGSESDLVAVYDNGGWGVRKHYNQLQFVYYNRGYESVDILDFTKCKVDDDIDIKALVEKDQISIFTNGKLIKNIKTENQCGNNASLMIGANPTGSDGIDGQYCAFKLLKFNFKSLTDPNMVINYNGYKTFTDGNNKPIEYKIYKDPVFTPTGGILIDINDAIYNFSDKTKNEEHIYVSVGLMDTVTKYNMTELNEIENLSDLKCYDNFVKDIGKFKNNFKVLLIM